MNEEFSQQCDSLHHSPSATSSMTTSRRIEKLPLLVLVLFVALLGGLIHGRVSNTVLPPMHDAISYLTKAKAFWDMVDEGHWENPFDIQPGIRPPGTITMSYPFGFTEDYRGFLFRSAFFPIVLFISALWTAGGFVCFSNKHRRRLLLLCTALSALPMFYHFDQHRQLFSPIYLGLMDNFLAAMAAIAAAFLLRGAYQSSRWYTYAGVLCSVFCFLIKPAGLPLMGLLGLLWVALTWDRFRLPLSALWTQEQPRAYVIPSLICFLVICAPVIGLSLGSRYFSIENMCYGKRIIDILGKEYAHLIDWRILKVQITTSIGWHWIILISLGWIMSLKNQSMAGNRSQPSGIIPSVCAIVVLIIGIWFWIVYTNSISQIRYFFPFFLIALILIFPRLVSWYVSLSRWPFRTATVLMLCPLFLTVALLISPYPPVPLQQRLGINVTSGHYKAEVDQSRSLVEEARKIGRTINLYDVGSSVFPGSIMYCLGLYEKIIHPEQPSVVTLMPLDWTRDSTFRIDELLASDYILFEPIGPAEQRIRFLNKKIIPDFGMETCLFRAWFSNAGPEVGLETTSVTSLVLMKVIDRLKFSDALEQLKTAYQWRDAFVNANPPRWIEEEAVEQLRQSQNYVSVEKRFGEETVLHGIVANEDVSGLRLEFLWQSLSEQTLHRKNLIYLRDVGGDTFFVKDFLQDVAHRTVSKGTFWRDVVEIQPSVLYHKEAKSLVISVFEPPGNFLAVTDHPVSNTKEPYLQIDFTELLRHEKVH